jgi:broad specificity phosphatase PhoE
MSGSLISLHNTYLLMRHGRSEANDQAIIQSNPEIGVEGDHLTEEGRKQVQSSITKAAAMYGLNSETIILTSDFARAKETAEIVQKVLGIREIEVTPKLRERNFGLFDETSSENYTKVWEADGKNSALLEECEIEHTADVEKRVLEVVNNLESRYTSKNIILVSHGDTLQIVQAAMQGIAPSLHRTLSPMQNGELRKLS